MAGTNLNRDIIDILEMYTDEVAEKVQKHAKTCADGAKKELQANSPQKTGDYAKSWKVTQEKGSSVRVAGYTVHSKDCYRLTHLLENGHAGPKASSPRTPAHPHIKAVEEKWAAKFEELVKEDLEWH